MKVYCNGTGYPTHIEYNDHERKRLIEAENNWEILKETNYWRNKVVEYWEELNISYNKYLTRELNIEEYQEIIRQTQKKYFRISDIVPNYTMLWLS